MLKEFFLIISRSIILLLGFKEQLVEDAKES